MSLVEIIVATSVTLLLWSIAQTTWVNQIQSQQVLLAKQRQLLTAMQTVAYLRRLTKKTLAKHCNSTHQKSPPILSYSQNDKQLPLSIKNKITNPNSNDTSKIIRFEIAGSKTSIALLPQNQPIGHADMLWLFTAHNHQGEHELFYYTEEEGIQPLLPFVQSLNTQWLNGNSQIQYAVTIKTNHIKHFSLLSNPSLKFNFLVEAGCD